MTSSAAPQGKGIHGAMKHLLEETICICRRRSCPFDLRMDGIEVRIGLFLKDQQSSLIFVRSGYAFAFPGILAISGVI